VFALLGLFCAPTASADEVVRGLVKRGAGVEFTGIEIVKPDPRTPVHNGGHPLDRRSASADLFAPGAKREVLREFSGRYEPVQLGNTAH
jgi:hypothetical protein